MDKEIRELERLQPIKGSHEHERLLRTIERMGLHVHNVVVFGAVKYCMDCPQQWEVFRNDEGKLEWKPL